MKRANRWMAWALAVLLGLAAAEIRADEKSTEIAPNDLVGQVVDADNKPIEGVEVRAWFWAPGTPIRKTDAEGRFRFSNEEHMEKGEKIPLRFRKEGYETQFHLECPVGEPNPPVVLGNNTYFEGRILSPDGQPAPNAPIQANGGTRRTRGSVYNELVVETASGADGRYRLYVEPGNYEITTRVPGTGVARLLNESIVGDQHRPLDIPLQPGATFVAHCIDHDTGEPVAGVFLGFAFNMGIEGTSDADGVLSISDIPPGEYPRVYVKADGHTRWWSDSGMPERNRYRTLKPGQFRRNFDPLGFDVAVGMKPVTIELERGVTIKGRVLDPDGNPVAGATVAPAMAGTGNSLTGDTRFSATTDAEGRYTDVIPAGGDFEYNLIAHDGKFQEWRTWANGVKRSITTEPGMVIDGLDLHLTRPGTVTGVVVDASGNPVAGRKVHARPTDKSENRYYVPTTETGADGSYTLQFISPGEHFVQVAPFWLDAKRAPAGTSQTVNVEAGKVTEGVNLLAQPER